MPVSEKPAYTAHWRETQLDDVPVGVVEPDLSIAVGPQAASPNLHLRGLQSRDGRLAIDGLKGEMKDPPGPGLEGRIGQARASPTRRAPVSSELAGRQPETTTRRSRTRSRDLVHPQQVDVERPRAFEIVDDERHMVEAETPMGPQSD